MSNFTMNKSNDNDGWKTVGGTRGWGSAAAAAGGGRDMPAAFSGGRDDPHKAERRAAAEAQAAREATEARAKKATEEKERKRIADATNFMSEDIYPSLGAAGGAGASKPPPRAMNFSKTVVDMAAREEMRRIEEEREAAVAAAAAAARARDNRMYVGTFHHKRAARPLYRVGDGEDLPNDEYPDEDEYDEAALPLPPTHDEEAELQGQGQGHGQDTEGCEFNAHIGSGRRRGDKGIW